jgi:Domain of unknown function (DUF4304)
MASKNPVKDCVKEFMLEQGFHLEPFRQVRGKYWVRELDDVLWFVELQTSKYGRAYFLNLGLHVKALTDPSGPYARDWHGQTRLASQLARKTSNAKDGFELDRIMDLRESIPDDERKARIRTALEDIAMPLFQRCDTFEKARAVLLEGVFFVSPLTEKKLRAPGSMP